MADGFSGSYGVSSDSSGTSVILVCINVMF